MEVSPFLIVLSLGATIFFGWLCFFVSRQPIEQKKGDDAPSPCPHKKPISHYYEDLSTGTQVQVFVPVCDDCMVVLPLATETLLRFPPKKLERIHQDLIRQGYNTAALPHIPVEGTP